jgi:hypothetical protein
MCQPGPELLIDLSVLLLNNFYCYQPKIAEDKFKEADFSRRERNVFFSEYNGIQ